MSDDTYYWRDAIDVDTFHFGVKCHNGGLVIQLTMHCDAIRDMFGQAAYGEIDEFASQDPRPIELSACVPENPPTGPEDCTDET